MQNKNLCALDLGFNPQSRIPKPALMKKQEVLVPEESKIPKFNIKPAKLGPEKIDNLPWKKGDLLDSLDLSSTNLKKMFQNRPKVCDSPGREKEKDPAWLKENFRESINEWAPKKIEPIAELKPTKRVLPRNVNKIGFAEKLVELKEQNKSEFMPGIKEQNKADNISKKVKFSIENCEKVNKRYEKHEIDEEKELNQAAEIEKKPENKERLEEKKINQNQNKKRQSKFVSKIKAIPEAKDDFLECELHCVNDEEAKLEASLARLDIKSLRLKHQLELVQIEQQTKQLEDSIKRANFQSDYEEVQKELEKNKETKPENHEKIIEIPGKYAQNPEKYIQNHEKIIENPGKYAQNPEKYTQKTEKLIEKNPESPKNEDYHNKSFEIEEKLEIQEPDFYHIQKTVKREISPGVDSSTNLTSQVHDNGSVFSAHPYPRQRPSPDSRSVVSEYPERPRNCYSKKEVHRIGAVYNEVAARSGRYSKNNPPPEYALPKIKSKEMISFRKPPPAPEYTTEVVKVNPNVDIKSLFQD